MANDEVREDSPYEKVFDMALQCVEPDYSMVMSSKEKTDDSWKDSPFTDVYEVAKHGVRAGNY